MLHSTLALSLLLIAVSSNLAMAIKKEKRAPQTLSRGWGDEITWVQTYEEGLYQAKKSNKPLMVIHHLEDCQYCQEGKAAFEMDFRMIMSFLALKKAFAENEEIQEMAQNNFVMLNLMHETTDKNLSPDGQYVPRIMFVDPSLTVRADITGRYSNRLYTYEPQDIPFLIENMKKALRLIQTEL
ncbi:anterior gradient protein 3 isoform X1 [Tyto alba]|uniref:anterior gradient protein 3 isoform X1 n=1 Tax=Tyto alba TaxID=56313 RepID=UPI00140312DC|nr:anterior gradient protein 3 isoform X1 [Tyto alba]XP_032847587.1 anterior gradient protein 3 isoform X1 [Tyto alba]